jgi:hypothetical protein
MPPVSYQIASGSWNPIEGGDWMLRAFTSSVTGIREGGGQHVSGIEIFGNYPNPFNPTTVLSYRLPFVSFVNLSVYDITGRKVAYPVNGWEDEGVHNVTFDASDLTSGIYFYRLTAGDRTATGKMVLMK